MSESLKKKLLYALELEKHLTAEQLTRLMLKDEDPKTFHERIRKALQRLEKENLLVSKHYGLGKKKLWSLNDHPVIKKLGYTPPRTEIHTLFYEHQLTRGDIFVEMARTGYLLEWESEKQVKKFRPDITMRLDEPYIYAEVERGNQNKAKLVIKVQNYINLFRETKESFYVLFVVSDDIFDLVLDIYEQLGVPERYMVVTSNTFIQDVLGAELMSRRLSHTLSDLLPTAGTE